MSAGDISDVKFDDRGLVPAVVQDCTTGAVLMMAWMNRESLALTLESGYTHFWSRSRQKLWKKGETSGNLQKVREVKADCDGDTLLVLVDQKGPACHTNSYSCFFRSLGGRPRESAGPEFIDELYRVILERRHQPPEGSYVASLMEKGGEVICAKVLEEASEVVEASRIGRSPEIAAEMADLWFHALVLLGWHGVAPAEVFGELSRRRAGQGKKRDQAGES